MYKDTDPQETREWLESIEDALEAYEPRVKLLDVRVTDNIDRNALDIRIYYRIIGIPLDPQSLNIVLERV